MNRSVGLAALAAVLLGTVGLVSSATAQDPATKKQIDALNKNVAEAVKKPEQQRTAEALYEQLFYLNLQIADFDKAAEAAINAAAIGYKLKTNPWFYAQAIQQITQVEKKPERALAMFAKAKYDTPEEAQPLVNILQYGIDNMFWTVPDMSDKQRQDLIDMRNGLLTAIQEKYDGKPTGDEAAYALITSKRTELSRAAQQGEITWNEYQQKVTKGLRDFIRDNPNSTVVSRAKLELGQMLMNPGSPDAAIKILLEVIADPSADEQSKQRASVYIAQGLVQSGKDKEAIPYLQQIADQPVKENEEGKKQLVTETLIELARIYQRAREYDQVDAYLKKAKEMCPQWQDDMRRQIATLESLGHADFALSVTEATQTVYEVTQGMSRVGKGVSCKTYQQACLRAEPISGIKDRFACRLTFKSSKPIEPADSQAHAKITKDGAETTIAFEGDTRDQWRGSARGFGKMDFAVSTPGQYASLPIDTISVSAKCESRNPTSLQITIEYTAPKGSWVDLRLDDTIHIGVSNVWNELQQSDNNRLVFNPIQEETGKIEFRIDTDKPTAFYLPRIILYAPMGAGAPAATLSEKPSDPVKEISGEICGITYTLSSDTTMALRDRIKRDEIVIVIPETKK